MFYGHSPLGLWQAARNDTARVWYYADNSYFDVCRGRLYRVERNALQADGRGAPDWERWKSLQLGVRPWRRGGRHVVVCVQSDPFMREVARWPGGADGWQREVLLKLKLHTDRPMVVRTWSRDKARQAGSLGAELANAWALVTHSSAAANEALLAGVPVFVTGECAARAMAGELKDIESPRMPDGREAWAAALAARQWSIEEIRVGMAWRRLECS